MGSDNRSVLYGGGYAWRRTWAVLYPGGVQWSLHDSGRLDILRQRDLHIRDAGSPDMLGFLGCSVLVRG
jgi:hypothetical protein